VLCVYGVCVLVHVCEVCACACVCVVCVRGRLIPTAIFLHYAKLVKEGLVM